MRSVALVLALACVASQSAAAATPASPREVVAHSTPAGWTFSDRAGMTLYAYDRDVTPGRSECNKGCTDHWPPLLAPADAKPLGDWSIARRSDGAQQWAFKGKPLYHYTDDAYPGAEFGERPENEVWHVARMDIEVPPSARVAPYMGGRALLSPSGLMLYTLDTDRLGSVSGYHKVSLDSSSAGGMNGRALHSGCSAICLDMWHPLEAAWIAQPLQDWSIAVRDDGTRQWVFRGKPLYTFANDPPKGANGDGRDGIWHAAILESAPPMPPWVKLQDTDGGLVAADSQGLTLYAYEADMNINRPSGGASERGCNKFCLDLYHPVLASADAKRVGDWSIVQMPDGRQQWAYKGLPLSTFAEDHRPGDIVGTKPYRVWHTIQPSGIPMQGAGGG